MLNFMKKLKYSKYDFWQNVFLKIKIFQKKICPLKLPQVNSYRTKIFDQSSRINEYICALFSEV
jgi:hypothetical protein